MRIVSKFVNVDVGTRLPCGCMLLCLDPVCLPCWCFVFDRWTRGGGNTHVKRKTDKKGRWAWNAMSWWLSEVKKKGRRKSDSAIDDRIVPEYRLRTELANWYRHYELGPFNSY